MVGGRIIPVFLGPPREGQPDEFIERGPMVHVHVAADADWTEESKHQPAHNGKRYLALLDTGAEGTAIDVQIADEIGASASRRALVYGLDGSKVVGGTDIQLIFPSINMVFPARAILSKYRKAGHTFDVILGRSFLIQCRFSLDGPSESYSLYWVG